MVTMPELPNSDGQNLFERDVRDYVAKNISTSLGEMLAFVGVEHPVPFGRIDILARDAHQNLVVIEVKRGSASREAIGQLQSYMGALTDDYPDTFIRGILIAASLDAGAEAALKMSRNIQFMAYTLSFSFTCGLQSTSTYDQWKREHTPGDPPLTEASQDRGRIWLPPSFNR